MVGRGLKTVEEKAAFLEEGGSELPTDSTRSRSEDEDEEDQAACTKCGAELRPSAKFCPACGEKRQEVSSLTSEKKAMGCCCGCCAVTAIGASIAVVCLVLALNSFIKFAVQSVGSTLMGVPVTLDSVNFSVMQGRVSITELDVASPQGYTDDLFKLGRFVFDVSPLSLLWGWMSDFTKPIELEDVSLKHLGVWIDMKVLPTPKSNAQAVVSHMNEEVGQVAKIAPQLTTPLPTLSPQDTMKVGMAKIKADRVELSNISASVTIEPLAPISYTLDRILIEDVGKKHDGVYLYEFIEILVRAILMSVIKASPSNIQSNLAKGFGEDLWRELDFATVNFDMGNGLEKLGEFSGWVSAQAAMMPLKMAAKGAEVTAKAVQAGTDMNTKALEIGSKLTGMSISTQAKATNAGVQASAKAAEEMAKLSTSFTNGFSTALSR